ncbi:MAG: ABC transporter permease [Holophagales bacterium]|jgi:putative ABC transport system permease protein|nr:ABC transporter permease [Holophagales bacterium]MBK9966683.1 ABC transporter permease [Holophagales bacterium]
MTHLLDLDHWQEIRVALLRNRTRTLLTAFGVFWGIFLLMVMLGSGSGLRNGVLQGFSDGATNSFFLWTQRTQKPYAGMPAGRGIRMTNADVAAIREKVPEAEVVAPRNQLRGFGGGNNVSRGRKTGAFSVMGDYPEIRRVQSLRIETGRFLNPIDVEESRKVAVIGTRVRELLFARGEEPIGDSIVIRGVYFQVVGVFVSPQTGDAAERDAQTIFVPFTTFQRAFNYGDRVGWMAIISRPDVPASVAEEKVLSLLRSRHKVAPDDLRAFGHFNLEEEYTKIQGLFSGIRLLVWIVGVGTLAAGVIGVSNIMLIIVRERTKEIGIRRALGAKPSAVVSQIVSESVILTSLAGYLGLVAGIALVVGIGRLLPPGGAGMFLDPDVGVGEALQALAILVVAGVLAGLAPAQRALAVSPTVALRSE